MEKIKTILNRFIAESRKGQSLKARATRGSVWLSAGSGSEQVLRLLRNMILTRLLAPEAFGIMAIVIAVNAFFDSFTHVGIKEAVIQSPDGGMETYLNGAWFFSLGRSVLLYVVAFFAAPFIAQFYENLELVSMMRFAFMGLLFRGMMSPKAYLAVKNLNFKRWIMVEQAGGIIGILVAIVLGFVLRSAWALIIGFIVEYFFQMLLSYIVCPYLPRLTFDRDHLRSLFKFARGMLGIPLLTYIFMKLDVFVIGKLRSSEELGLYSMAAALARVPFVFVQKFLSPLLMPSFSEMQDDFPRINKSIIKMNIIFGFIGIPLITFVIMYGDHLLSVIYTPQYAQVHIPFAILFSAIMMQIFNVSINSVYLAIGKPEILRLFTVIRAVLVVILIYPLVVRFGLVGASIAVLSGMLVSYFYQIFKIRKITGLNMGRYWGALIRPVLVSTIVIVSGLLTRSYVPNPYLNLAAGFTSLLITYTLGIVYFRYIQENKNRE